jgi:hydrogenase/urease accessory protein HupE
LLASLSIGHRHLATVAVPDGEPAHAVLYESHPEVEVGVSREAGLRGPVALPLFRLGIEHILTGYDHLLFLLGLILVGGRLGPLLVVVTAFTLAHSLTLGLAALGAWAPSPGFVEPAIALSIAYVGVENWFVRDASRRWLITFPFGLVHGFGFAGALQEISLPASQVPVALAAFNVGVEAGQVAVLAAVLPGILWLSRRRWFADRGMKAASAAIAAAGLFWFVTRVT